MSRPHSIEPDLSTWHSPGAPGSHSGVVLSVDRAGGLAAFYQQNLISLTNSKPLERTMNPRFDVFRKQTDRVIRWIGTAASSEEVERLIQADSGNGSDDDYLVVHTACGVAHTVVNPPLEKQSSRSRS